MRKILGVFELFLGVFEKTREKKDRVSPNYLCNHFGPHSIFSLRGPETTAEMLTSWET